MTGHRPHPATRRTTLVPQESWWPGAAEATGIVKAMALHATADELGITSSRMAAEVLPISSEAQNRESSGDPGQLWDSQN